MILNGATCQQACDGSERQREDTCIPPKEVIPNGRKPNFPTCCGRGFRVSGASLRCGGILSGNSPFCACRHRARDHREGNVWGVSGPSAGRTGRTGNRGIGLSRANPDPGEKGAKKKRENPRLTALGQVALLAALGIKTPVRMSDNENQSPSPSKQTSSVPLKKETVRVTLKAADAPAVPSATVPLAPPVRPPVPGGAPRPPAPTVPLRPAGVPSAPAPTIRLATPAAPASPGAPTVALKPGGTPTLPKATVQLQPPTSPIGTSAASQAPTLLVEEEEEQEPEEGLVKILAGVGFAAALVVLALQLMVASIWVNGEWSKLFQ